MYKILLFLLTGLMACKGKVYRMPSSSMAETIREGEPFYVKKSYQFKRNDLVVFRIYSDDYATGPGDDGQFKKHWEERCFRLIAISGDSLEIKNNVVYLNNKKLPFPPGCKLVYQLYSSTVIEDQVMEENIEIAGAQANPAEKGWITQVSLSQDQLRELRNKHPEITRVEPYIPPANSLDTFYAKPDPTLEWNTGNYGPLYIPRPGETIEITDKNYKLFQHLPGIQLGRVKISEVLYFVMGDNRYFASDSRFTGFIPHSNMRGIVK